MNHKLKSFKSPIDDLSQKVEEIQNMIKVREAENLYNSLGPLTPTAPTPIKDRFKNKGAKGEETMDTQISVSTTNEVQAQRSFLLGRLEDVSYQKKEDARKTYHIEDDDSPKTWTELQERIASGKFVWDKEAEEKTHTWERYGPFAFINWRDPNVPADEEGFEKYKEKVYAEFMKTRDDIKIKTPEQGLESLRAFQDYQVQ